MHKFRLACQVTMMKTLAMLAGSVGGWEGTADVCVCGDYRHSVLEKLVLS